jgi:FkbM family methyltransferase
MIAAQHGRMPFSLMAKIAGKYLRSYNNISNWDMPLNGEDHVLSVLLTGIDGDVLDVGANHGDWSTAALRHIRPGYLIHCFEVLPDLRSILIETLTPYSSRIRVSEKGLGSSEKIEKINFDARAHTISSKYDLIYPDADPRVISVQITTGDLYSKHENIKNIALLKIDVEGMEMEVLSGFSDSFAANIVQAVQFEHGPSHVLSGDTLRDFVLFFEARDFVLYEIFPHRLIKFEYNFSREVYDGKNFLAIRRDLIKKLVL